MKLQFLLFMLLSVSVSANVDDFIEAYQKNSNLIPAAREELKSVENQVKEVRGGLFPAVQAKLGKTKIDNIIGFTGTATLYEASLELVQPIYIGGKLFTALDLAKVELASSKLNLIKTQEQVRLDAWNDIIDYVVHLEKLATATEQKKLQLRNLKIVKRKKKLGNAKIYELDQAEADHLARNIQLEQMELAKKQIEEKLKKLSGLEQLPKKISGFPELSIPTLEETKKNSYDVALLILQKAALKHSNRIDIGDDLPSLNVAVSQGYRSTSTDNLFDSGNETSTISINANIPLFSGLSSVYKRKMHSANTRSLELNIKESIRNIELQYNNLIKEIQLRKKLLRTSKKWLDYSDKSLKLAIQSYRNGQVNFLQLLQIQSSVDTASGQYWDNWAAYHKAMLNLQFLAGRSLKE
jgi:outer membrane protein TolC